MEQISIKEIIGATGGKLLWGNENTVITSVTTDSRKSGENMLFIPLEGDTFDGHEFIRASFDMGAAAALTHKDTDIVCDRVLIRVDDTKKALADIARFYLDKHRVPVVALTGSVGKTTTKDMVAEALSKKYSVLKTQGNFNNDIGLPLTIFNLTRDNDMAVLEMGMNHFGEIHHLASIAHPDTAIITNIGMSHIENLGSREGILKAKTEITDFFDENSTLILNGDDDMLQTICGKSYTVITYGIDNPNTDYRAKNIEKHGESIEFDIEYKENGSIKEVHIHVALPGTHNIYNALAAFAAAKRYGVEDELASSGIGGFVPSAMRMDIKNTGRITLINDCYNASPASVEAALDVLMGTSAKRHIAILGDILEMGGFAPKAHAELGEKASQMGVDALWCVGENAKYMCEAAKKAGLADAVHFENNKSLIAALPALICDGDALLVKASRGMKFEQIAAAAEKL